MELPSDEHGRHDEQRWPQDVPWVPVRQLSRALDFYLTLGFEVASTADGWVLLRAGDSRVVLAHRHDGRTPATSRMLHVWTTNLAELRQRLQTATTDLAVTTHPVPRGDGQLALFDPDLNLVLVDERDLAAVTSLHTPPPSSTGRATVTVGPR